MSKSGETASGEAPSEQSTASVFDFLYNDNRRIGSYLTQLHETGILTEIRFGEQASKNNKRGFSVGGQVLGTGGNLEWTPKEGGSESSERVYDPFWANALEFLNALDDRNMIRRDLAAAPIGSLVLLSGRMSMIDLSLIKALWDLPSIKALMAKGLNRSQAPEPPPANRQARRMQGKRSPPSKGGSPLTPEMELLLEMLPVLPHSLNVIVTGPEGEGWANLREEHLVGTGSDLVLKHGVSIPGEWQMLGILDAQPDMGGQGDVAMNAAINFADPARLAFNSLVGQMAGLMSPIIRILLGRPGSHYGITPLLIFREVGHTGI